MRVGAYQFADIGNVDKNYQIIQNAIQQANERNVKTLVFPECTLTGYPPKDIHDMTSVDFDKLNVMHDEIQV